MDVTRQTERVRSVFEAWADAGRAEGMERGHGPAARAAFDMLALEAGQRYLDVGCGNGYTVRWAAGVVGPAGRAVGLDLSTRMVARAREASAESPNVAFHEAAFPEHPFEPASFDAIFSMETLYYLADLDAALVAVHDLLAPGGRFVCVVDYYEENRASHTWPAEVGCPMTRLSQPGWKTAFERAGLAVVCQGRLRRDDPEAETWKRTQGSLVTLGRRSPSRSGVGAKAGRTAGWPISSPPATSPTCRSTS